MKKIIFLTVIAISFLFITSCNYNGSATVIVKNIGSLTIVARLEYSQLTIPSGGEDTFKVKWPGHDDMHVNLITYPTAYKATMGGSVSIWLKNGETKTVEIEYYPPEN